MSRNRLVAIHQPNFFPWLGFFDKIARADVFILMDNAQFQKTGGCWTNRVKMMVGGEPRWVTAPVDRSYHGTLAISDIRLDGSSNWREKVWKTIEVSYGKASCFDDVAGILNELVMNPDDSLADYNIAAIESLRSCLGLGRTEIMRGSELDDLEASATDLLISMVKSAGGDSYLAGGGAEGYQEDAKFTDAGIDLVYQRLEHPVYSQYRAPEFAPGLSVVDALANCGFEGTARLLETSARSVG
ncbi:MAG: wbmP [Actinobacteria bacterium]|nr:wbmP [Actinomycetota bacterium]